ncbi:hypothetical protein [Haloarchaeobius baliensis]|uniref:hypothetical protein n=1 Tax=Haloarchaeobius baliensis TaxID=1670458 RepID=UPI003F881BBE
MALGSLPRPNRYAVVLVTGLALAIALFVYEGEAHRGYAALSFAVALLCIGVQMNRAKTEHEANARPEQLTPAERRKKRKRQDREKKAKTHEGGSDCA